MATNESLTPEKQLLKLIENPKQASVRVESAKREGKKWFSFPALKGRLDFWKGTSVKQWFSLKRFSGSAHGVERINSVLKVLVVVMAIYTGYSVFKMVKEIKNAANSFVSKRFQQVPGALVGDAIHSGDEVLRPVARRFSGFDRGALMHALGQV